VCLGGERDRERGRVKEREKERGIQNGERERYWEGKIDIERRSINMEREREMVERLRGG
jgi:hypothetical protein